MTDYNKIISDFEAQLNKSTSFTINNKILLLILCVVIFLILPFNFFIKLIIIGLVGLGIYIYKNNLLLI